MSNPLFGQFGGQNNGLAQFIDEVNEFKRTFNGDPKQEVQNLLNSGKITQEQFNQFAQMANQIMSLMPK